ncbi:MAG TPA: hypothetical protein VF588_06900 [Pyrinomonadaceae bacterium]|jgi:hypothetical protein
MQHETSHATISPALRLVRKTVVTSLAAALLALPLGGAARAQTAGDTISKPRLIANARKYSDKGIPAASGRSGSASLTARALLGKDGKTAVELTTGALDAATTAPGQIVKAQLKPLSENGEALYARNFTGLSGGGRFATTVGDLRRGQQLQAQAGVTGIDPNRTDVVTVVETVKLRPDLKAAGLVAPAKSAVNTVVNISAVVRELNGDVGAKANVVLYVDGVAADRAEGVWVDASGTVSAAFAHVFASEGVKQLAVKVERVTPGDYNEADNAASGSIEIVSPAVKLSHSFVVSDNTTASRYVSDYAYNIHDGATTSSNTSTYGYDNRSRSQDVHFYGWSYRGAAKFPIDASVTELSDGAAAVSANFPRLTPDYAYESDMGTFRYSSSYAYRQDYATGLYFYVNTYSVSEADTGYNYDNTQVVYSRHAGDVTYQSASTYRYYYAYQGGTPYEYSYSYNYDYSGKSGVFVNFGSQYGLNLTMTGADGTVFTASPRTNLVPVESTFTNNFCWEYSYETTSGRNCYEDFYSFQSKDGASFEYNDNF